MPIFTDGVQKWARIYISTLEIAALTAPIKRDKNAFNQNWGFTYTLWMIEKLTNCKKIAIFILVFVLYLGGFPSKCRVQRKNWY